jgi:hypothetical protein
VTDGAKTDTGRALQGVLGLPGTVTDLAQLLDGGKGSVAR